LRVGDGFLEKIEKIDAWYM